MKIKKRVKINENLLTEEDVSELVDQPEIQQVADAVDADEAIMPEEDKGEIWKALERSKRTALRQKRYASLGVKRSHVKEFPNLLLVGSAGVGKTSTINEWAEETGINLFTLQGSVLDPTDMGGLPALTKKALNKAKKGKELSASEVQEVLRATKVGTDLLDQLDKPNSVLFLDELNRARKDVRQALLQLICDHVLQDPTEEGGWRYFPNFLFTVAAINPENKVYSTGKGNEKLDSAELDRFRVLNVEAEKGATLNWLRKHFTILAQAAEEDGDTQGAAEERARLAMAEMLLTSKEFRFDTMDSELEAATGKFGDWNKKITSPRGLTSVLEMCDGTKKDFLDLWSSRCNNLHWGDVKRALANYVDIDDKANRALQGTDSQYIKKRTQRGSDALRANLKF